METLHEVILNKVQYNIKHQLLSELDSRLTYTGHGVEVKTIDSIKTIITNFAKNEMDTATRRLYLLMN